MKVIVTESKIGIEYLSDVISTCDQNGIECIVDDHSGEILYYLPKEGRYGDDKLLQNSDESIFDLVQDKERLASVLKDAQGDEFKEFAVQWNALQKKGDDDEVYKTQHCNPIRGNFAESSFGCKYDARSLTEKVAAWYEKAYPTDQEMADEMRPRRSTFQDVLGALESGKDVYEVIGADDSIVRERVFEELSKLTGKDYDYFYDKWLHTNYEESNMRRMGHKFSEKARNTRPLTAKDREEFEKFRKRWKSLGKKKKDDSEEEEDYVDDFGLRVNGIEAQVSESDDPRDWSASEGEVEIMWDTDEYEDFGIFKGEGSTYLIDYDRVDTHDDLINEVCRLIGKEYPDLDFDPSDFVIVNEDEFWEQRGGNPGKWKDDD